MRTDRYDDDRIVSRPIGTAPVTPVATETATTVHDRPKFSIGATFLGWCVASFLTLVFLAVVAAAVGSVVAPEATTGNIGALDFQNVGIAAGIGSLLAIFLAYLVGGYAAGRIAHWDGAKHGAVVPLWSILLGIVVAIAGATVLQNYAYLNPFPGLDFGNLTGGAILGIVLGLVAMFLGAILGGRLGERSDEHYVGYPVVHRRVRGRPL